MRVRVESVLPCAPEAAWAEVQKSSLLAEVLRPLVAIRPADGGRFLERWRPGLTLLGRSYLFGLIPLGTRTLHFESINQRTRDIQTREHDPLVRRWDHRIRVRATADGQTLYADEVDLDAGPLTGLVWLFAQVLYRHRQRRWRAVARRLAGAAAAADR